MIIRAFVEKRALHIRRFGPNLQEVRTPSGCLKARTFSARRVQNFGYKVVRRALLSQKGSKLWIQVVRRTLLVQKESKTMYTGSEVRTFSAKRVQNYGYRHF